MSKWLSIGVWLLVLTIIPQQIALGRAVVSNFPYSGNQSAAGPATCITQHDIGDMVLGVSNNATFGDYDNNGGPDCFTGAQIRACEYPKGSNSRYLYAGAFWIGAVLGRDTLVSTGADGWSVTAHEFNPDVAPIGNMVFRSITDPSKPQYDGALSEQDLIAVYYDTCVRDCLGLDNNRIDPRPHRPLFLEVSQRSFAWSYSYAKDFVLFDYAIKNMGVSRLKKVYMGIYVDADVYPLSIGNQGAQDDVCGFRRSLPAWYSSSSLCQYEDTINIAWIADNDGDLSTMGGGVPNVTGTRIVRTPSDSLEVSFNWWVGNTTPTLDFGPQGRRTYRDLSTGGIGTPEGDRNKYYFLRNKEFDYDQMFTAVIQATDTDWMYPPQGQAPIIAQSLDTRYLLSFGPFDIEPGQVLPVSFAYVGGKNFHSVTNNLSNLPYNPQAYVENLNFDNFGYNSTWSSWIYDTPGYDSDSDGYAGSYHVCVSGAIIRIDTIIKTDPPEIIIDTLFTVEDTTWYQGDGVPDFKGASPPPSPSSWSTGSPPVPALRVYPTIGKILIRFNGLLSETTPDAFSRQLDFEGYRIYYARDDRSSSYTLLDSYDREDYNKFVWDSSRGGGDFVLKDIPYTLDSLRCAYAPGGCDDLTFDPLVYTRSNPFTVPGFSDSVIYFAPQDYNRSVFGVSTGIRKLFPDQLYPASLNKDSCLASDTTSEGFFKYFEYEYTIDNLLPTVKYYVNVTSFDFGSPSSGLPSLESERSFHPAITYALESQDSVQVKDLKVQVYPNPYRLDGGYAEGGYEGTTVEERRQVPDRNRRIHFYNLPPTCTIRIFTLDGDLVREINHDLPASDPLSNHDTWDLITRNTQLAVSGLYYWTVEAADGNVQVGKLVVIM